MFTTTEHQCKKTRSKTDMLIGTIKSILTWLLIGALQWKANGHRMNVAVQPVRRACQQGHRYPFRTCSMTLKESKVEETSENIQLLPISSSSGSDTILSTSFLILNAVAVIWGTQHVVIKSSLDSFPSPSVLNFWRFATSAVLFLPAFVQTLSTKNTKTLQAGAELGLWTTLGFAFQSIGLLSTTASRSAFLLYLNVKIVPFLACLLLGRTISTTTWLSALLALSGTSLLSSEGGGMNTGDLWCVAAAVASACFILRIEKFSRENDAAELSGVSFVTVTTLCALWIGIDLVSPAVNLAQEGILSSTDSALFDSLSLSLPSLQTYIVDPFLLNPWPILYLGAFSTGVCNYLQTVGQRDIAAENAAIIYSMDPVTQYIPYQHTLSTHPINALSDPGLHRLLYPINTPNPII